MVTSIMARKKSSLIIGTKIEIKLKVGKFLQMSNMQESQFDEKEVKKCEKRKKSKYCNTKFRKCPHVAKKTCFSCYEDTDANHVILRGYCIFCLFDGKKKLVEKWDSLREAIVDIGLGIYNLGYAQGLSGSCALYLCQNKDYNVEGMHELYSAGYNAGSEKSRSDVANRMSQMRII